MQICSWSWGPPLDNQCVFHLGDPHGNFGIPAGQADTGSRLPCQLDSSFPVAFVGDRSRIAAKICENVEGWPARVDRLSALSNAGFSWIFFIQVRKWYSMVPLWWANNSQEPNLWATCATRATCATCAMPRLHHSHASHGIDHRSGPVEVFCRRDSPRRLPWVHTPTPALQEQHKKKDDKLITPQKREVLKINVEDWCGTGSGNWKLL